MSGERFLGYGFELEEFYCVCFYKGWLEGFREGIGICSYIGIGKVF